MDCRCYFTSESPVEEEIKEYNPNLVIVDLLFHTSREDGIGLIKRIRRVSNLRDVPIVVLSKLINHSPSGESVRKLCLDLGVVPYGKFPPPTADQLLQHARSCT